MLDAIDRLLARQGSNGAFGLWSTGGDDAWLYAYVTDFLTRARERGFAVPDVAHKLAIERLRNFVANAPETKLTPVMLPPGRFRLVTRPSLTGSLPVTNKIGTVVVASLAARAASTLATITFTGRRRSSSTSAGSRSI